MALGPITNNGLMVAEAPGLDANTIEIWSSFSGLVNTGEIYALAVEYFAVGVKDWSPGGDIVNSGLIAARSL